MGVPQGSVLGPTLFLIYLNDFGNVPLTGSLYMYADDAAVFYSGTDDSINCYNMNRDLYLMSRYFRSNLLTLNLDKTKYMHFHDHSIHLSNRIPVLLNGQMIESVSCVRYLGLELDSHLNFSNHINTLCRKVCVTLAALYKVRDLLPQEVLRLIYFSLFHSHVVYLCSLWGQTFASYIRPLQVLQNRALKILYNLPPRTSTCELYSLHAKNVLPVRGIHELQIVKLVRQIMNDEIYHQTSFAMRSNAHSLRDTLRIGAPAVRTNLGSRQFSYAGPYTFNRLPSEIRGESQTLRFTNYVKKHLLSPAEIERLLNS